MLIINADDWGRSVAETDAALKCIRLGTVSSVTAMMFMDDSVRAAAVARDQCVPTGLHLNLAEPFRDAGVEPRLRNAQRRLVDYLASSRLASLVYHPGLQRDFRHSVAAQLDEFRRLYGREPTHVDGHRHQHLCANVLLSDLIPSGSKVRKTFFFWPGEKGLINRAARGLVNRYLGSRYQVTDYFFALSQCLGRSRLQRVLDLGTAADVELMAHPVKAPEFDLLSSEPFLTAISGLQLGSFARLHEQGRGPSDGRQSQR
jgi:hypothetical protein